MTTSCLQEKIDKLQNTVHALLHKSNYMAGVYVDDLARLNNEIHEQINDLYPCHGKTAEQEAALCLLWYRPNPRHWGQYLRTPVLP